MRNRKPTIITSAMIEDGKALARKANAESAIRNYILEIKHYAGELRLLCDKGRTEETAWLIDDYTRQLKESERKAIEFVRGLV